MRGTGGRAAAQAPLSSVCHDGRKNKSDHRAIHLLSLSERRGGQENERWGKKSLLLATHGGAMFQLRQSTNGSACLLPRDTPILVMAACARIRSSALRACHSEESSPCEHR